MKCSLLTLSCALDGELSRERQSELEAHLVTCERCRTGMRYLREETDRISQLIKVELPSATATALLERAKIVTTTLPFSGGEGSPPPPPEKPAAMHEQVADPFNLMGIGTPVIESAEVAAEPAAAPLGDEELFTAPPQEPAGADATAPKASEDDGPGALAETENPDPPVEGVIPITGTRPDEPESEAPPQSLLAEPDEPGVEQEALAASPEPWAGSVDQPEGDEPAGDAAAGLALDEDPAAWDSEPAGASGQEESSAIPTSAPTEDRVYTNPLEVAAAGVGEEAILADRFQQPAPPEPIVERAAEIPIELPPLPLTGPPALTPPPPSILEPASSGWQPNGELRLAPGDIAAAEPEFDALGGEAQFSPSGRTVAPASGAAAARSPFTPMRPADSVVPGLGGVPDIPAGRPATPVRRRPAEAPGGRGGRSQPITKKTGEPRNWTRTATIAIAAVAIVLIGWSLLHHSSTPAPQHHSHKIAPVKVQTTPTAPPTAKATATPSLTLTSTQTFGGIGTGYQVQSARYGLHDNNAQFWVVFQLGSGSGAPKITTGFDGAQTLYVEMAGTAPGVAVAQPASGSLVTSVTVGHVSGFTGAVYVLQLSRAAQVSGSLLPGSPTGSSGERVVLILQ